MKNIKRGYTWTNLEALEKLPLSRFGQFLKDSKGHSFFWRGNPIDKWEAFAHCKDFRKIYLQRVKNLRTSNHTEA